MIAFWIQIPLEVRYLLVGLIGVAGGALANHAIFCFAYFNPRPRWSPWGKPAEAAPPRRAFDRIPVLGWLGLRREGSIHGEGFWIRPLLIELGTAAVMIWLYRFETQTGGLLPPLLQFPKFLAGYEPTATHAFFSHALLLVLMVAATFIDFDERTIPDVITIPGTLLALAIASLTTWVFMPTSIGTPPTPIPTTFDSPWFAPAKWMMPIGCWTGLGIWTGWCFAPSDRRWSGIVFRRGGLIRTIQHFINGLFHYGFWKVLAAIWLIGVVAIYYVWSLGGESWLGLFSALVGLAVGGGVVWAIRIVATWALNMEAMGFGDVTLMAMIGAFIGWQAALISFFLAPFAAIVIVLVRYIVTRDAYTPFGPYLCAGTLLTILNWHGIYNGWLAGNLILMGPQLLWLCLAMLGLMAVMLFVWRCIKLALLGRLGH